MLVPGIFRVSVMGCTNNYRLGPHERTEFKYRRWQI